LLAGRSQIISIGQGEINGFPVKFYPGFGTSLSISSYLPLNDTKSLKTDIGVSLMNGPGKDRGNGPTGVERVLRINIPLEFVLHKEGIGGFIGIENGINISLQRSFIGFLLKPYYCNLSTGLCYFNSRGFYTSLIYSIDALAFARPGPKSWVINLYSTPHFHFGMLGIKFSYYFWTLSAIKGL